MNQLTKIPLSEFFFVAGMRNGDEWVVYDTGDLSNEDIVDVLDYYVADVKGELTDK